MRRAVPSLLIAALLAGAVAPASAQDAGTTTGPGAEEERQAETRQRRAEAEAELDVLRRTDVELQADLDRLEAEIAATTERAAASEVELEELRAVLGVLEHDLTEAQAEAEAARDALKERAVAAYVDPRPQVGTALLTTGDLATVGRRQVLLSVVADRDQAVLDELLAAELGLRTVRDETDRAAGRAVEVQLGLRADQQRLVAARAEQEVVRDELEGRIAHFQDEVDALAAEESRLADLIATRQAAVPPTQPSTTTTAAPTTTTTSTSTTLPGSTASSTSSTQPPATTTTTRPSTTTTTRPPGMSLTWPTAGPVTSVFGPRWGRMHQGIDIGAPTGQSIVAAASGTVFFAGAMGGYGNLILVDHGNGIVTAYAHQSAFAVSEGASVSRGQTIGYVGNTGNSTGPHLHFEVRSWGVAVDPMGYLS